jgi:hypothetical protein
MPTRERMTSAGLQVLLETDGHRFGPELNADDYDPWPPLSGRTILAGIARSIARQDPQSRRRIAWPDDSRFG